MQDILGKSLKNLKWLRMQKIRITAILLVLSLVVSLDVFWILRQPGWTLAGDATCGIQEHTHDETCGELVLVCALSEEPHVHDETCYETRLVEPQETRRLVCEETEEPHLHNEDCYETIVNESGEEETVLCCALETEPHEHTESCFVVETGEPYEEQVLICGLSEEGHIHGDDCYEWEMVCGLEEHVHSISCYSDTSADVETQLDWQAMFADYPYTGDLREDLAGIARTQVGYTESERNFEVDRDGVRHGYTRYGAWYGAPYSDWSAMFVSFCLHYAGADPEETPGNSGADSMAKRWKKLDKYAGAGEYVPEPGDLVFFTDNTVGIVADVYHSTFRAICGDLDDEVQGIVLPLTDDSIAGWGLTVGTFFAEEEIPMKEDPVEEEIEEEPEDSDFSIPELEDVKFADLADGPVFQISAKEKAGLWTRLRTSWSALTTAQDEGDSEDTGPWDVLDYLKGCGGTSFVTLLDENDREPKKDEKGNYVVEAGKTYYVEIVMVSDAGFVPGTYLYNALPAGVQVKTGEGTFILDKTEQNPGIEVGTWKVSSDNTITMVFNEKMTNRSEVKITARMQVNFTELEGSIKFDGDIIVTVEKPPPPKDPTKLMKYGIQGSEGEVHGKTDPEKIYWTVEIDGHGDSQIPGSLLTDKTLKYDWTYEHRYTDSDIAAGLSFGASVFDPETGEQLWHTWKVYPGDPGLTWTETGWSYRMPEKVVCGCWVCGGNQLTLGNDGWTYYVEYTSTPEKTSAAGSLHYVNHVEIDNQIIEGWAQIVQSGIEGVVSKEGALVSDAGGGKFFWEIEATIPGRVAGERADRNWCLQDRMTVVDQNGDFVKYIWNDIDKATVTATCNGQTITVPNIRDATENDPYAWNVNWSKAEAEDGVEDLRQIDFLSRCKCTGETCGLTDCWTVGYWTADGVWKDHSDYCNCWLETENVTFTITYETTDTSVIQAYGGMGYKVRNTVLLNRDVTVVDDDAANVLIPSIMEKEIDSIKDYIVNYHITVNEAMLVLTDGSPLHIRDEMTDTLAYIGGSLVITSVDAAGKTGILKQNVDFTVTYDGTGEETNEAGKPVHVLEIDILKPQPVKYILDYDTTFIVPDKLTSSIKYDNSATVTLWGETVSDSTGELVATNINVSAKTYKVDMYKTSASTGEPLGGAVFGLFNEEGGLIDTKTTDDKGWLQFETNVVEGIILRAHQLYYLQELQAPAGYRLDDTKYWFCFCASKEDSCATCDAFNEEKRVHRIPAEQIGKVDLTNELMSYDLPATGGPGICPIILCGVVFMIAPLVYGFTRRRKHERRVVE